MNSSLRDELMDRQYSYEHTVQGGRYRLDSDADDERRRSGEDELSGSVVIAATAAGSASTTEDELLNHSSHSANAKKSVRFTNVDCEVESKKDSVAGPTNESSALSVGYQSLIDCVHSMRRRLTAGLSWHSLRMLFLDWLFLAILGIGMALMSMFMDYAIDFLQSVQIFLFESGEHIESSTLDYVFTYLSWLGYTELLVIASASFVHYVAPQAIGSGIPEMKTILRGVILKDYLTLRTLLSKLVGLTLSLGSGIPIGKMGPFVHLASISANLLSNIAARVEGAYSNESRKTEMLAAACATGVACTFSAPIGGVLFSIEVTTMYFSVRNYWRGFFAAACGATVFRLLRVVAFESEVTLVAFYQTHFPDDAFDPEELPFFALIGVICGLAGSAFIYFYRNVVMFLRQNPLAKRIFQKNWIIYPAVMAFAVASITYPRGYGRFLSGKYKFTRTILDFFSNCTWTKPPLSLESPHGCTPEMLASWINQGGYGPYNVFLVLTLFSLTFFFLAAVCSTMPIPCGIFMPNFVVGAALGRLVGEILATIYPDGIPGGATNQPIYPGVYSVVGAAALTGAITHSVSVAMICCEITGQLIYIIPLMIAVIIANAICTFFQPSVYDVMIKIKHLPFLPDIPPSNAAVHLYTAEHIMVAPVKYLCRLTTFDDIRKVLVEMPRLRSFPVVDDPASMMLLGSVPRRTLIEMLRLQIGDETRKVEAQRRIRFAIETIDRHFRETQELQKSSMADTPSYVPLETDSNGLENRQDDKTVLMGKEDRDLEACREETLFQEIILSPTGTMPPQILNYRCNEKQSLTSPTLTSSISRKVHPSRITIEPIDPTVQPQQTGNTSPSTVASNLKSYWKRKISHAHFHPPEALAALKKHITGQSVGNRGGRTNDPTSPKVRERRNALSMAAQGRRDSEEERDNGVGENKGGEENGSERKLASPGFGSCVEPSPSTPKKKKSSSSLFTYDQQPASRNITNYMRQAKRSLFSNLHSIGGKKEPSTGHFDFDMTDDDERREWEQSRLAECVEIDEAQIDPAPFQLVRRTSVYKVHSVFSLLDLNRAYVTDRGRLVGVVALRDLRIAIENAQNGLPLRNEEPSFATLTTIDETAPSSLECIVGKRSFSSTFDDDDHDSDVDGNGDHRALTDPGKVEEKLQGSNLINHGALEERSECHTIKDSVSTCPISSSFFEELESMEKASKNEEGDCNEEPVHDLLTPTLKIVRDPADLTASLRAIKEKHEEEDRQCDLAFIASARRLPSTSSWRTNTVATATPPSQTSEPSDQSPPSASIGVLTEEGNEALEDSPSLRASPIPLERIELVQAVAYLRRRSISMEAVEELSASNLLPIGVAEVAPQLSTIAEDPSSTLEGHSDELQHNESHA